MQSPLTQAQVRGFALSLPEVHEHAHFGRPDFRVRSKIFATLPQHGRSVNLKTTPTALDMLLRSDPGTYQDAWNGRWVGVELERADPAELRGLIVEAYCLVVPKARPGG